MLIEEDVAVDTHKLFFTEEFYAGIDNGGGTEERSLHGFFDRRQVLLLGHEGVKAAKTIDPESNAIIAAEFPLNSELIMMKSCHGFHRRSDPAPA